MKHCSRCHKFQTFDQFTRLARTRDGLDIWCRSCKSIYRRAYWRQHRETERQQIVAYYRLHAERLRMRRRERYQKDLEWNRTNSREAARRRAIEHPDYVRSYRAKMKAQGINFELRWRTMNPNKVKEKVRRYQARKIAAVVELVSYDAILLKYGDMCYLCGLKLGAADVHFDHVIPLSRGGKHAENNIRPTHGSCNLSKASQLPSQEQLQRALVQSNALG